MLRICKFFFIFFLTSLLESSSYAVKASLDRVVLNVNEEPRFIRDGETFRIVWGDTISVGSILFKGGDIPEGFSVNFVGYPAPASLGPLDDRGFSIRSHKDLLKSWSVDGAGKRYVIRVKHRDGELGNVYVEIERPKLRYVVLKVNGEDRILREGEVFKVKGQDRFLVKRFETNIEKIDDSLDYKVIPAKRTQNSGEMDAIRRFDLCFYRFGQEFARIPILMSGA